MTEFLSGEESSTMNNLREQEEKPEITVEEAFEHSGGFGRHQWFSSIFIIMVYTVHGYIPYNTSFLLIMPFSFTCWSPDTPENTYKCEHTDFYVDG